MTSGTTWPMGREIQALWRREGQTGRARSTGTITQKGTEITGNTRGAGGDGAGRRAQTASGARGVARMSVSDSELRFF